MLRLRVQSLRGPCFEHLVDGTETVLGRSSQSDIVLAGKFTSRRHALITRTDDGYLIEDLGSHNGTRLNGKRIDGAAVIGDGDVVEVSCFVISAETVSVPPAHVAASSSVVHNSSGFFSPSS